MTLRAAAMLLSLAALSAIPTLARADGAASANPGIVSHINILSDKSEDISTPEAWKKTYIKDGMTDQEKAIAVWKTVTRYRHQDNPPAEGLQTHVHDPFKTFHVYGYGQCCCASADIEGLARYIDMPARGRIINAHSVPEVWYDKSWHLLDSSLMFYLIKPDGKIASVDEMKKNIADWKKDHPEIKNDSDWKKFGMNEGWKQGPSLFATCEFYDKNGINGAGWHGWWSNMTEYNYKVQGDKKIVVAPDTNGSFNVFDYGAIMGYQLNVQLREGEKLTRGWSATEAATGLNRNNPKNYESFLAGNMKNLGQQQKLGDHNPGRVGNGTLEYNALADSKLTVDAINCENLTLADGKIRITDPNKPASLTIRMPSSYLFLNGELLVNPVIGNGGSIKSSISFNNGLDWSDLAALSAGEQKIDLKQKVFNKYDYRVKFDLAGAGTGLDALKFTHAIQHSQAALPVITAGENKITFNAGPQEGTITVEGNMAPGAPAEEGEDAAPKKNKALTIADFHPTVDGVKLAKFLVGETGKGSAIIPVATPGDITRVRLGVHWRARDPRDGYTVSASFDNGQSWKEVGKLEQANPARSTYLTFTDVPANARNVQVKFDGTQKNTTCIFDLRVDVDYKEPTGGFRPVKVTYNWEENVVPGTPAKGKTPATPAKGTPKSDTHVVTKPEESWTITCGEATTPKSFSIELVKPAQ